MAMKNLKNVDFKQFFVHKGEKVGLWICVGVMALLVVLMIKDVVAGPSAGANAEKLTTLSKSGKQKIDTASPDPNLGNLDPQIKEASSPTQVPQGLFAFSPYHQFFDAGATEDRKWRLPVVLPADDFRRDFLYANVPSFTILKTEGGIQVGVLASSNTQQTSKENQAEMEKRKKKSRRAIQLQQIQAQLQQMQGMMGPGMGGMAGARMGGGGPMGGGAGANPMMGGGGKMGGGMSGMMQNMQGAGMQDRMRMIGQGTSAMTGDQNLKIVFKPEDQIGSDELAEQIIPYRMVIVTGAFPYKAEMEQFRSALRFKSIDSMLNDKDVQGGAEFAGISVQRREARPGEALDKKEWADLPVEAAMKAIMILAVEPDKTEQDEKLKSYQIIPQPNRTVMRRPKLDDNLRKDAKYPEELPDSINESLKAMEEVTKGKAPTAQKKTSRFDTKANYDVFGDEESSAENPNQPSTNQPMNKLENEQETTRPEKILVRFYDTTVQPGMVYQYRVAVRMANPCYKSDRAVSKNITQEKEIRGAWAELPNPVRIPDELMFYAVDEKRSEGGFAYTDKLPVQIHHWLERVQTDPNNRNASFFAGDWAILERDWVRRGEFIGGLKEVEVPIWWPTLKKYLFAVNAEDIGRKRSAGARFSRTRGVPVDFNTQALLVDFEGGKRNYQVGAAKVLDEAPIEALVLTHDGKLLVHKSKDDTENKERAHRYNEWKETQEKVKNEADNKGRPATGFEGLIGGKKL